ncbi:MAG TPA: hypothetical protein VNW92_09685 [Polyangiaceae bacterium]|jgi:hypothetical protein|nr:hypothetical protein [Polyangiaceae bacterium]
MNPESSSAPLGAPCETLFELFSTTHSSASVGRMLKGIDIGRFVLLREARVDLSPQALAAIDVSRSLAHPRFAKVLGAIRTEDCHYVASEYIPGVSLFELTLAVRKRNTSISPAVAVQLICDALKCAASAQKSLLSTAGVGYVRCIFPETIWIAEFGDVLLTEVGVAPHLVRAVEESAETGAATDLMAAAVELFHLASGQLISAETTQKLGDYVPAPLASVLEEAMGVKGKEPFATLDQFVGALSNLPADFSASEEQVCAEIARVAGPVMELRRRKLALFERGAASQSEDEDEDSTKFYRTAAPEKRDSNTTRPPPPDGPISTGAAPSADVRNLPFGTLKTSRLPTFEESPAPSEPQLTADAAPQATKPSSGLSLALRARWFNTAVAALALAAAAVLWFSSAGWIRSLFWSLVKRISLQ